MPLSEHEQRQLEQIERAPRADEPRFADAVHATDPRVHYKRRVIAAALGVLIGVGLLLAGVVINVILTWVAGMWAVTSYRRMTGLTTGPSPPGSGALARRGARDWRAGRQAGSGLTGRLEERWRRRQEGDR